MKKIVFLTDSNFIDYYKEVIISITAFLKPETYEIRKYENLKHLNIRNKSDEDNIYYTFCTSFPLKEHIFKILSQRNLVNPLESQKICINKVRSDMIFRKFKLPVPAAISTVSPDEVKRFISNHEQIIFKERESCSGAGHFIADKKYAFIGNKKLLLKITEEKTISEPNVKIERNKLICGPPFYIQSFLKPDSPEVWRLYLVDKEVVFSSKRYRNSINKESDYVINVAKDAKYQLEKEPPSSIDQYKSRISEILSELKLKVATIDFIIHKNQPYFLEMDCDGIYTYICRGFKNAENYEEKYNLDSYIAKMLTTQ